MATLAGKAGSVKIGAATVGEIDEWDFNPSQALLEKTPFGANSKTFQPGLVDGTGSFKGRHDMTDAQQLALHNAILAGTIVALRLYVNAVNYYSGNAWIKAKPMKANVAQLVEVQFDFQADGDWVYT